MQVMTINDDRPNVSLKAKFYYAILVADRSEASRRPAASWNLAYHALSSSLAAS